MEELKWEYELKVIAGNTYKVPKPMVIWKKDDTRIVAGQFNWGSWKGTEKYLYQIEKFIGTDALGNERWDEINPKDHIDLVEIVNDFCKLFPVPKVEMIKLAD